MRICFVCSGNVAMDRSHLRDLRRTAGTGDSDKVRPQTCQTHPPL